MPTVEVERRFRASAEAVWGVIGDFWALDQWHPMVPNCHKVDDLTRMIKVPGMNTVEILFPDECGERRHVYTVRNSPMPMNNYRGQVEVVEEEDGGSTVRYTGRFDPPPMVPAAVTSAMLGKFFKVGFAAVARKLGE